jgi:L-ascorbate metabolism protein UlaG (beta-lactamase superfamily)
MGRMNPFKKVLLSTLAGVSVLVLTEMDTGWTQEKISPNLKEEVSTMMEHVHWLGHSSIKILGGKIVYVDPYEISGGEPADLILITHDHYDHLSPADIAKIQGKNTVIILPASSSQKIPGNIRTIRPGESITLDGIEIRAVPAYNLRLPNHSKNKQYVGYVFKVEGVTYYHAGDTDYIPEMKNIRADVVFLPVGGTVTMGSEDAAKAAGDIKPKVAVPIHWGSIIGSKNDAEKFQKLCKCEVRILRHE